MYGFIAAGLPARRARRTAARSGTGTVMRPATLRGYARQAGFDDLEVLPVEHEMFRFYRCSPRCRRSVDLGLTFRRDLGGGSAMAEDMKELVDDLRERLAAVRQAGRRSRPRAKHTDRGKLLVRDRVDRLLDPGSPFLELSPLAAFGMYGDGRLRRAERRHRHRHRPGRAAASAWSSPTTPPSRAAPTTR